MLWIALAALGLLGVMIYRRIGKLREDIRVQLQFSQMEVQRLDHIIALLAPIDDPNRMANISEYAERRNYEDGVRPLVSSASASGASPSA